MIPESPSFSYWDYVKELLSFTDNRLIYGLDYKIHVPVYNDSFKTTGNFTAQLSYSESSAPNAGKTPIATTTRDG